MADLLMSDLRATLPAGITFSAVTYPDASSALKAVSDFNQAVIQAQAAQNAANPGGSDVSLVTYNSGAQTTLTRDGETYQVRPATYQYTLYEVVAVSNVLPILQ